MKQQLGECKELTYILNCQSGYYEKQPTTFSFQKIPFELKRELSQCDYLKNQGANEILQGRQVNKKRTFHTGLIPIGIKGFYQGDHVEFIKGQKKKSLIIFWFQSDSIINVYFFNRYYIDKRETRLSRCYEFANYLQKKEGE